MGTDFCAGILPAVDAVVYTALYMQSTPGEARNDDNANFSGSHNTTIMATTSTATTHDS
jgi:hypothetical protein